MGIIKRQSIKQSLVNYIAVGIAAVSTIYIYPQDAETYGLARFIIDTSMILVPFILMGFGSVTVRFFPHFKNPVRGHNGFLFFMVLAVFIGSIIFLLLGLLFKERFYQIYAEDPPIYQQFLPYLIPIAILMAFLQLFTCYSSNFQRIAVPALFQNLIKLTLPLLIIFFVWQRITIEQVINGILSNYVLALVGVVFYVYWLGQLKLKPDFSLIQRSRMREIRSFAIFSLFGTIGSILAFRIDSFMVTTLLDFESNGVFAIAAFIANAISIPTNAVGQISGPIISESLDKGDLGHVKKLYQDSSINLLVVGLLLFVCIMASVEDLFSIMPNNEQLKGGVMIVFLIGIAKVIDMGTSINNQIINYSKYYRFGFYAIIFMAFFNIIANFILIPKYHIIGAAMATLASLMLYNLVKLFFIQWKFKMQPFTSKSIQVIFIAITAYLISMVVPEVNNIYLNIVIRSVITIMVYGALTYSLRISDDLNAAIYLVIQKIKSSSTKEP